MSKSWGNAIWLSDTPDEIFGKMMSLNDNLIIEYFSLATSTSSQRIREIVKALKSGVNPLEIKKELAVKMITELYNKRKAAAARAKFEKTFTKKEPEYSLEIKINPRSLAETIAPFTSLKSVSDAKRMISQMAKIS